ncbi:N-acyl-phosphatidylethanolamine-hydrolyzing phospholipase D [Capsaspora owczarzaki ATCC 30864]|uniref:N-acyl-phosphatidylethanolamine-hydrolyzing phospholipase D n=1 Tax=Capsaspora owczarzaki (strain ATCC 30864) TaxID=595528 RepID=UPI00035249E0|nr:N-acyl-phosphatidylethanolamine-hydrolyzing phospholipase D [Capsaspora owczarzaki ATCC 30864]|eukprot:XP_004342859.2 N-acyl-phosphatidylethanolamine-hydrolyzing phospholipase D [Capsaspora owczarzaki ATCC 30864]
MASTSSAAQVQGSAAAAARDDNFIPKPTVLTSIADSELVQPVRLPDGRFDNPFSTWAQRGFTDVFKWMLGGKRSSPSVPKTAAELDRTLPILRPDFAALAKVPQADATQVMWVGHASVLVQFDGVTVITDPVFSHRCGPTRFTGPKRIREPPCAIAELPKVDVVLISHNHYDHLDHASIMQLHRNFAPTFYVPLGNAAWFHSCGIPADKVVELGWWQEHQFNDKVKFACTPVQHWCRRGATDMNKALWGGWAMLGATQRIFFSGDTGYCEAFSQIGAKYGGERGFDLALIAIGAYDPRWFMRPQHINPEEAVLLHQELRARRSLGIHWGTFILTDEHYLEPPKRMADAAKAAGLADDAFFVLKHGEVVTV